MTSVTALDGDGDEVTLVEDDDYSYNSITEEVTVTGNYTDIYVTHPAGYSSGDLSNLVKHAVKMLVSTMYNNREDFVTGLSVANLPVTAERLLKRVRRYVS